MPDTVVIQYNPYEPRLSILIDDMRLSEYSRLIQFVDEDIWDWSGKLLDAIYEETRRPFTLRLLGTPMDAAAIELLCRDYEKCRGFEAGKFVLEEPLQSRMKKLSQYIKGNAVPRFDKSRFLAGFVFLEETEGLWETIKDLDVNNAFCSVQAEKIEANSRKADQDIAFVVARSAAEAETWIQRARPAQLAFALIMGEGNKLVKGTQDAWYFETSEQDLFTTIFQCLLEKPLRIAFRKCYKQISREDNSKELRRIGSVEPLIDIQAESAVEVGRSSPIEVTTDPPIAEPPELVYKVLNESIARCDRFSLFGMLPGETTLEIYRQGENKPLETIPITVYTRNRINKIVLADDDLLLGLGDTKRLGCEYAPLDADNIATLAWRSTDPNVIHVDQTGFLTARGVGRCRIICAAESVAAQCICEVKPYLESIGIDQELDDDTLYLAPSEEREIRVLLEPKDVVDGRVSIISSDMDIVNVLRYTLIGKKLGETMITIRNESGRVEKRFRVIVRKEKKPGKFQTFFKKKERS